MAKRTDGKTRLNPAVQQRLCELADELRGLIYGEQGFPNWGTPFAEIESDAKEVGHEFIRLLMEQTSDEQSRVVPNTALQSASGELAQLIGREERTLETESGRVQWQEPKAYLPKSRKDFFPSKPCVGPEG
jgi:hypothetical protein